MIGNFFFYIPESILCIFSPPFLSGRNGLDYSKTCTDINILKTVWQFNQRLHTLYSPITDCSTSENSLIPDWLVPAIKSNVLTRPLFSPMSRRRYRPALYLSGATCAVFLCSVNNTRLFRTAAVPQPTVRAIHGSPSRGGRRRWLMLRAVKKTDSHLYPFSIIPLEKSNRRRHVSLIRTRLIHSFVFRNGFNPGQDHGGSGACPGNTAREAGIHPGWDGGKSHGMV